MSDQRKPNALEIARQLYEEHDGDMEAVVKGLMGISMTKTTANTYYLAVQQEHQAQAHYQRNRSQEPTDWSKISNPAVEAQPTKRTALIVLEVELEDYEDTYQTAELLVELLNNDFNNQFSLVAATDKIIA